MNPHPQHLDDDNDNEMIGTLLSRRRALRLLGLGGGAGGTSAGTSDVTGLPGCVVRPAMTEGPYYIDEKLCRSDIRKDTTTGKVSEGVPLTLAFVTSRVAVNACQPRANVLVDV